MQHFLHQVHLLQFVLHILFVFHFVLPFVEYIFFVFLHHLENVFLPDLTSVHAIVSLLYFHLRLGQGLLVKYFLQVQQEIIFFLPVELILPIQLCLVFLSPYFEEILLDSLQTLLAPILCFLYF